MAERERRAQAQAEAIRAQAQAAGRGQKAGSGQGGVGGAGGAVGRGRPIPATTTLFDAAEEEARRKRILQQQQHQQQQRPTVPQVTVDGFETLSISGAPAMTPMSATGATPTMQSLHVPSAAAARRDPLSDPEALLSILETVRSERGRARQEYGRIYGALWPLYTDLAAARTHADPLVFKAFRDPERQARMLAILNAFSRSDYGGTGARERRDKLAAMISVFEGAAVREFEQGYEFWDVDGRMRRYAHVLDTLNGGAAAIELFVAKHPIFQSDSRIAMPNPVECLNRAASVDDVSLEPSREFFEFLAARINEQADVMARIFPKPQAVFWPFVDRVRDEMLVEYVNPLLDECHERSTAAYVKAVSGVFEQTMRFVAMLRPPPQQPQPKEQQPTQDGGGSSTAAAAGTGASEVSLLRDKAKELGLAVFEPHLDLYLQDELDFFTKHAEAQVADWERRLSEQDATVENFYMANFNRQAAKSDFLSTFKKVVMMPVSVVSSLPTLPIAPLAFGGGSSNKSSTTTATNGSTLPPPTSSPQPSRPQSPGLGHTGAAIERRGSPLPEKAPTDELAAKAALMTSRLEGIRSLCSIEVALNLVHAAKASLGRAAVFVQLGGQAGGEAREQCENIFVVLLRILGQRHVRLGFERAVEHLSHYKPRDVVDHGSQAGVAPLVTFIELVNVGDLISQMIDVFYEQQLAAPRIADRNDFLDPAGLAKKKFEQMLDESVAAGLNRGIDVLMDEVEYICATTQQPTDYNPEGGGGVIGEDAAAGAANGGTAAGGTGVPDKRASTVLTTFGGAAGSAAAMEIGPTSTAQRIVELVRSHTSMLVGSTDKSMLDVFNGEVGLRLFTAVCKHIKRQRISTTGAIRLIADATLYYDFVSTSLATRASGRASSDLLVYFRALRELSQIYLIDPRHAKEMAVIIADSDRFAGVFRAEEVYEFAERRADWYQVRRSVERAMYGMDCAIM